MKYSKIKLIREQTANHLKELREIANLNMPIQGWIRTIRKSLGMNTRQLAERMGVKRQRISEIETGEVKGNLTVETLKRTAEALNCKFVYAFIPNTSLEDIVRKQAESVIKKRMKRISHTMALEEQKLNSTDNKKAIEDGVEKILFEAPGSIWDE